MTRVFGTALLLAAPLLLTQPAAAQDCFCGTAPTFGMTAPDAFAPETPDTTIESVLIVARTLQPQAPAAPEALWCTSANDPRCMPMHTSDAPSFRALSGGPVAVGVELTNAQVHRVAREMTSMTPAEGLPPARGVQRSLDRPPRA
jgi:hypothetical protein